MKKLDKNYWDNKYVNNETGWDIGYVSTPIKEYINQLQNKDVDILIPGAGNGYEVEYLVNNGFKNVNVVDVSAHPLQNLKNRIPSINNQNLFHEDFFNHNNTYDLIIEQTFFCALDPNKRIEYVDKIYDLLKPKGKIVGVLFDFPLTNEGPPFGGNVIDYIQLFYAKFEIKVFERCYNSIKPRAGSELFFIFEKK
ncbi:MAG TPA: methyltransferase [Flavobacteriaceae bacterium]|nr:methyltransferase [Flavobacteriaceae bacterium]